jgi:tRNA(adenine34) deaminase
MASMRRTSMGGILLGSIPIGAVITNETGEILSIGRNRSSDKAPESEKQICGVPLAHAELNALLALDYAEVDPHLCILYSIVEPCPLCIGAICVAGIKNVHYAARDAWSGSTNLLEATPYLRWKSIKAVGPQDSDFETVIHMMQVDCQLRRAHPRVESVLDAWEKEYPEAVRKGRMLFQAGELPRMREEGFSAAEALSRIHELMLQMTTRPTTIRPRTI